MFLKGSLYQKIYMRLKRTISLKFPDIFWRGISSIFAGRYSQICFWRGLSSIFAGRYFQIYFWRGISSIFAGSRVDICRPALLRLHRPRAPGSKSPFIGQRFQGLPNANTNTKIKLQIRMCLGPARYCMILCPFFCEQLFPKSKRHLKCCFSVGRPNYTQIV